MVVPLETPRLELRPLALADAEPAQKLFRIAVSDNGTGIPRKPPRRKGMGLRIMAYRADLIGATLSIERLSTRGTKVTCALSASGLLTNNHAAKN